MSQEDKGKDASYSTPLPPPRPSFSYTARPSSDSIRSLADHSYSPLVSPHTPPLVLILIYNADSRVVRAVVHQRTLQLVHHGQPPSPPSFPSDALRTPGRSIRQPTRPLDILHTGQEEIQLLPHLVPRLEIPILSEEEETVFLGRRADQYEYQYAGEEQLGI